MSQLVQSCVPSTFTDLSLFGAKLIDVLASPVLDYTADASELFRGTQPSVHKEGIDFCNVTISYTHPGHDDLVHVEAWLPANGWNGRLQAAGGAGVYGGRMEYSYSIMRGALADGYATVTTDAGTSVSMVLETWLLKSPGNTNWGNLETFGSRAYNEVAIISKDVIEKFYGQRPAFSYWNGCSTGGRQGLMLAQRYPDAFDGIAAGAPAIYYNKVHRSMSWTQQIMNMSDTYPFPCELDELRAVAVAFCDHVDGVVDGVVADHHACLATFNPFDYVGKEFECSTTGDVKTLSYGAASVANATWRGPVTADGRSMGLGGYGFAPGADITGNDPLYGGDIGPASTKCESEKCVPVVNPAIPFYYRYYVTGDPAYNMPGVSHEEYDRVNLYATQRLASFLETDNHDLSAFHNAGGKLIVWHGINDNMISSGGTEEYSQLVQSFSAHHEEFYRYYEIPGMGHCFGGKSGQPVTLFDQLRAWVENDTAPVEVPIKLNVEEDVVHERVLCPYPKKARFDRDCGDPAKADCFSCEAMDQASERDEL